MKDMDFITVTMIDNIRTEGEDKVWEAVEKVKNFKERNMYRQHFFEAIKFIGGENK